MSTEVIKVEYEATIPTGVYANIKPKLTLSTDNIDEAFEYALSHFINVAKVCSDNPESISRNDLKKE